MDGLAPSIKGGEALYRPLFGWHAYRNCKSIKSIWYLFWFRFCFSFYRKQNSGESSLGQLPNSTCKVEFQPNIGVLVVVVVLTLTRIIKSVVTGQAPVTLELKNTPGKNTHNPRWYTHISQLTQFMPPPETYKSEIGSQSTMYVPGPGRCIRLTTHAWRNQIFQGRLPRIYYT